ncbi:MULTISPECIES: hypothetical protein [unclassified Fibrobacter]|uniref:hypothetical protein n=1 Tax=unclassified Fibrobacter TaxID=2634177 RepID=UPI0025BB6C0F|nr:MULTISPECIES: hypothetical protein [unclassified Fibrobacter]
MKKLLLALSLALFCVPEAFSQDIIHLKNGKDVEAKIIEMDGESIRYKKFSYQDGMDLVVPIGKVASVTYANGEIETFDEPDVPAAAPAAAPTVVYVEQGAASAPRKNQMEDPESVWYKAKENAFSVWAQPLGFALWGPMVGVGYRRGSSLLADVYIRLPQFGYTYSLVSNSPDELSGVALGFEMKSLVMRSNGGWYGGGLLEVGYTGAVYSKGALSEEDYQWYTFVFAFSGGYRFCFGQGFHLDVGIISGILLVSDNDWRYSNPANSYYSPDYDRVDDGFIAYFGMPVLSLGIDF